MEVRSFFSLFEKKPEKSLVELARITPKKEEPLKEERFNLIEVARIEGRKEKKIY